MDTNTIYCTACGSTNSAGARYCAKCGAPLQSGELPSAASSSSGMITLSCPNCGGKLEVTADMERFACMYCGREHIVHRTATAVSLAPVVEELKRVGTKFDQVLTGSDRLAAEQTIQRLKVEIPDLEGKVAQKEAYIQAIIPRESLHRLGRALINFASTCFGLGLTISILLVIFKEELQGSWVERFTKSQNLLYYGIVFIIICVLVSLLGSMFVRTSLIKRSKPAPGKRLSTYDVKVEQAQAELAQLQADLQKRKQQLEQLNQYTAER
jgi:predicted RNA-binding Zn-ribbon protein involved in translation (DUF1610 family)